MNIRKIHWLLAVCIITILLSAIALTACAKPAPAPAPSPAPAPAPSPAPTPGKVVKPGGTLTINYSRAGSRFGVPLNISAWNFWYGSQSLERLIEPSDDQPGVYVPMLATSWKLAPDKLSYTFYLRKGIKFHDGTDFNAIAVKWNFDKVIASKRPEMAQVTSIDIIDDYTIRANLSAWNNQVLAGFESDAALIISPTAFETKGEDWCNEHPIGTGPFKIKDFLRNQYVKYEKNGDYWGQVPYIDELVVLQIPEAMTAQAAFLKGEIDILYISDGTTANELQATGKFIIDAHSTGPGNILIFNSQDPSSIWSNKKMREALEYALDKERITKALLKGYAVPIYETVKGLAEAGVNSGTTPRIYNPEKAKQLIAEAGYAGVKIKLTYFGPRGEIYVAMQQQLAEVGIQVELNRVDPAQFAKLTFEAPTGNELRNESQRGNATNLLYGILDFDEKSIYMRGIARTAGFQALLDKALQEEDQAKIVQYVEQLDKLAYEDAMFVPIFAEKFINIMHPYTKDVILGLKLPGGKPYPKLQYAWLDK